MQFLFSPTTLRIAAGLAMVFAVAQAILSLLSAIRRFRGEAAQQRLAREILQTKVEAARTKGQIRLHHTRRWDSYRRFIVDRKVEECDGIYSFYLKPFDGQPLPPFEPGQYLTFDLKPPGATKKIIRCYSLSDAPASDTYRISVKRVPPPKDSPDAPPGIGSNFLHDHVNPGDILDAQAPRGTFTLNMVSDRPVILIGGGVGITPLLSMLNTVAASGFHREVWLFLGVQNGAGHPMKEDLETLDKTYENFNLVVCYSRPRETDIIEQDYQRAGHVSVEVMKYHLPSNNYDFYMCGPSAMMQTVSTDLTLWGVPEDDIHFESFGDASVKRVTTILGGRPASATESHEVVFRTSDKSFTWKSGEETLLDFAESNGIVLNSGCRTGNCGTCSVPIRSGSVDYISKPGAVIEPGTCLTCISVPKEDLVLEA